MPSTDDETLQQKILEENKRVHTLENHLYLKRHPEQTNWYQSGILQESLDDFCRSVPVTKGHLLDIGCGTGYVYLPLLERGCNLTGIDLSDTMIEVLGKQVPENSRERSELIVADVVDFVQQDSRLFDGIIISAVLHHLYDYEEALRKIFVRLKPGGTILILFEPLKQGIDSPARYTFHKRLAEIDEAFYRATMKFFRIPLMEDEYEYSDYQRQFGGISPLRLKQVLAEEGLKTIWVRKYCARRHGFCAWIANEILGTSNTFNIFAKKS